MIDDLLDPYDQLQRIEQQCVLLTIELDLQSDKLCEACGLLEQVALQVKQLSEALFKHDQILKILNQRLTHLESRDD